MEHHLTEDGHHWIGVELDVEDPIEIVHFHNDQAYFQIAYAWTLHELHELQVDNDVVLCLFGHQKVDHIIDQQPCDEQIVQLQLIRFNRTGILSNTIDGLEVVSIEEIILAIDKQCSNGEVVNTRPESFEFGDETGDFAGRRKHFWMEELRLRVQVSRFE